MPAQTVIDSLEFARTGQFLSGSLPIEGLARLKDSLHDELGEVRYEVRGTHDARGRPVLTLDIRGLLHLQCQRCLGMLEYPLWVSNTLLLLTGPGATELEEEEAESIEASSELDVGGLVEDEIILSLPYSPRHEEGACRQAEGAQAGRSAAAAFEKLAALKRQNH
jgi:uncharacterized protein